jgi:hypothetical protein
LDQIPTAEADWIAVEAGRIAAGASVAEVQANAATAFPDLSPADVNVLAARAVIQAAKDVRAELAIQPGGASADDLGRMFHMQFMMEMMSQYIEGVSNVLQSLHEEMASMARATKGQ